MVVSRRVAVTANSARCRSHVVPLSRLSKDLAHRTVPNFAFVVPNLCHDMHDCSASVADAWLRSFLKPVLAAPAYARRGAVVITFDEDDGTVRNHVATVVVNRRAAAGRRLTASCSHYSLLRSVEDAFGVSHLRHAGDTTVRPLPLGPLPGP